MAAPLTELTFMLRPFTWTERAKATFSHVKVLFTTALVLSHPDPAQQFVVEVDASDMGVRAILLQRSTSDGKLRRLFQSASLPSRMQLRCGEPGAAGTGDGIAGVAPLGRGVY